MATAPTNQKEETEQLTFVMSESLRNHPQSNSFVTLSQSMYPWGQQTAPTFQPFQGNFPADPLNMHYSTFYPYMQNYHPNQFILYPAGIANQPKYCPQSNCSTSTSTAVNNATVATADNANITGSCNMVRNDTSDGQNVQISDNNRPVVTNEDEETASILINLRENLSE